MMGAQTEFEDKIIGIFVSNGIPGKKFPASTSQ